MTPPAIPNSPSLRRSDIFVLALCALLVALLYSTAVHPDPDSTNLQYYGHRYYGWQAEAWLQGRLDLGRPVPAALLALPDPYDPDANKPLRFGGEQGVHDLSLYRGKLYMYWGPTPTLVAFLPWRLLTGQMLATATASAVFAYLTWLASGLFLVRTARKFFPEVGPVILTIATLGLAGSNWAIVTLARACVWETPIFAACCFGAIAWWLLAECQWARPSAKPLWLAAASASWGLAIGSRPIWIIGTLILLLPLWPERKQWREHAFMRLALAAVLPVTVCVLALLAHNYARFGSLSEFGQHYQLAGVRMATKVFSLTNAPFNLQSYFFAVPRTGAYFPFLLSPRIAALPPGYLSIEFTFGLLVVVPYLWCALLLLRRRVALALAVPVFLSLLALLAILPLFLGAASRYELELATPLALLASLGLIAAWPKAAPARFFYAGGAAALVSISILVSLLISSRCRMIEWGEQTPHPRLGRIANDIATAIGWGFPDGTYGIELDLTLPPWRQGIPAEALVASGSWPAASAVMVDYPDPDHIRFHYFHDKLQASSALMPVSRSARSHVKIEFGAMLPPPNHPFWGNLSAPEIEQRRSSLKITCGNEFLTATVPTYPPAHSEPNIGGIETEGSPIYVFSGQIFEPRLLRQKPLQ